MSTLNIHGRSLALTELCRVLYPGEGILKGDVVGYYQRIAPTMMPYLRDRLVGLHRFPEGIRGPEIHERDVGGLVPTWIPTLDTEAVGRARQIVVQEPATLAFLAQQCCITPRFWPSRAGDPTRPDRIVFALQVDEEGAADVAAARHAARLLRSVLTALGLVPFVMATGPSAYHVHVPIHPDQAFGEVKLFACRVAERCERIDPTLVTSALPGDERAGRIHVDYLANDYGQTEIAPYALLALPGAPVATPLRWEELDDPIVGPETITMREIFHRLARVRDPWRRIGASSRSLGAARARVRRTSVGARARRVRPLLDGLSPGAAEGGD